MNRLWLTLCCLVWGCSNPTPPPMQPISLEPTVKVARALPRTIVREVAQPGVIEAYERTAIYAKVPAFVDKWYVDIGKEVKAGDTLVELTAPEMVEQQKQMQAQVELDKVMVDQARTLVMVAESNVTAQAEMVSQVRADVRRYQADVDRWQGEVKRLTELVKERVVDQQVLDETRRQLTSSDSAFEASQVAVKSRDAQRMAAVANLAKSKVDVKAAEAKVRVSDSEERRLAALVGYLKIVAPYDGVVTVRNVAKGDFVLPATGDPSQGVFSLGLSPSRATPLYVVVRSDPVLFVVGVPEADAAHVDENTKARVRVPAVGQARVPIPPELAKARVPTPAALEGQEFEAKVTRTSWALEPTSRTLLAQIEVPNPNGLFKPGMYAYGTVTINRTNVRALPAAAITQIGNETCCYMVVDGKAIRTPIQASVSDGTWTEVTAKYVRSTGSPAGTWQPFDGTEIVISGNLSDISDGQLVKVDSEH